MNYFNKDQFYIDVTGEIRTPKKSRDALNESLRWLREGFTVTFDAIMPGPTDEEFMARMDDLNSQLCTAFDIPPSIVGDTPVVIDSTATVLPDAPTLDEFINTAYAALNNAKMNTAPSDPITANEHTLDLIRQAFPATHPPEWPLGMSYNALFGIEIYVDEELPNDVIKIGDKLYNIAKEQEQ